MGRLDFGHLTLRLADHLSRPELDRTVLGLSQAFARLHTRGLLHAPDPDRAASDFNWLIMSEPINLDVAGLRRSATCYVDKSVGRSRSQHRPRRLRHIIRVATGPRSWLGRGRYRSPKLR